MQQSQLQPAGQFAKAFGVKAVIYGPPGGGKTPIINSCPRPVLLACEPGLLSMRGSTVPTCQAFTQAAVDDFFKWFLNSAETKNFDTLAIDSGSQMCEIALTKAKETERHGLQQYGKMADSVWPYLKHLYYFPQKHIYLIAKEQTTDAGIRRPYYPGKFLPVEVPHLYDCILRVAKVQVPGLGERTAFQCQETYDIMARNRTGTLDMYEPPDFAALVRKAMT